ncbi:CRISPR system precrRNA processing endoribonuclease RAMP protein Cas6 [Thiorhodococcus mannitoliphagus]|uniref:CRISPR system precrRNA processing endoribonuclease RAMP protein Cas6 n=1 Tax=Thiorhodococcus mannitoliphagus TaxID=329406 RepID=A0A6P1DWD9_9GAMM|nr:CRISPR system precrRNA processing endoribonuclease RAMP protein Cas6 [Thiorhodococcus mannitoliphagus]NEX21453.1 CRISPR system precrRNA processing endoribonuclease RAMP protein Cas6 [Thiorhodococcus mannitoliphagus]
MDSTASLGFPPLGRFRFHFRAQDRVRLPPYSGSAWRGLLGHGLRRTACVTHQPQCQGCLLIRSCVYSTFFETPPPPEEAERGFSAVPHPYVLDIDPKSPRVLESGAFFHLTINLFGPAIGQVPYLIHALAKAGERGIGSGQGRFALTAVEREQPIGADTWERVFEAGLGDYHQLDPPGIELPAAPSTVSLRLITPLRIKRDGHFLGARDLSAADLLRALYQRVRRLAHLYGGDPEGFDAKRLSSAEDALLMQAGQLHWHDWTRFSSRQDKLMQMGGLVGEIALSGPDLPLIWPVLWLGQWTHIGKGTAFGLGGYRLHAA